MDLDIASCQVHCHVRIVEQVISEILLDHIPLVPEADNELAEPVAAIDRHDVPKEWAAADGTIGFGRVSVSSEMRVPWPPAKMTVFNSQLSLSRCSVLGTWRSGR